MVLVSCSGNLSARSICHNNETTFSGAKNCSYSSRESVIEKVSSNDGDGQGEISKETGRRRTERVEGYTRKDGTHVKPYYRSPRRR